MKEHDRNLALGLGSIIGLLVIANSAFSRRSKNEIIGRAGNRSEISGVGPDEAGPLHCSHLNHTRDKDYDNPERGLLVTPLEHLIYHRVHRGRAEEIGLNEEENEGSISLLQSVVLRYKKRR